MLEKIVNILSGFTEAEASAINENSNLRDDLGINSIDFMDIIVSFEEEFDIEISDRKAASFQTVGDVVKFLEG